MEDYSSNLEELQERLHSLECKEIDYSLQLAIVEADNERKRKIDEVRSEYKKVKAEVEEERMDMLKRMRAWAGIGDHQS